MSNTIAEKLNKLVLLTTRIKNQYGKTSLEDAVGEIEQDKEQKDLWFGNDTDGTLVVPETYTARTYMFGYMSHISKFVFKGLFLPATQVFRGNKNDLTIEFLSTDPNTENNYQLFITSTSATGNVFLNSSTVYVCRNLTLIVPDNFCPTNGINLKAQEEWDNAQCVEFFSKLANINDFTNKEDYIITLSANTYGLCEDSTLAIATSKGWAVTSG